MLSLLRRTLLAPLLVVAALGSWAPPAPAQAGFTRTVFVSGLQAPTALAFAPDGRLFVAEQSGRLRVVKNGVLLVTPFATVPADPTGERGLLGIAFDPQFATNRFVYVYYTTRIAPVHNRVTRFTASGDVAVAGSETPLLELENLSAGNHNGGAIHFGPDGKLYVAVGENAVPANAQTLTNRLGKILRVNANGSIPSDNPFVAGASGDNRAIWALGLRNPYTFAFQPLTGRMLVNDVGAGTWEEINDGAAGANYGWPETEGPTSDPRFVAPVHAYGHGGGLTLGCAISGGAFYDPEVVQFPLPFLGSYFFADFCSGWVRRLTPADVPTSFATGVENPVDLRVGPDGSLYVLARGAGVVYRYHVSQWPHVPDSDRDGIPDAAEAAAGRNPAVRDNDVVQSARLFVQQQYRDVLRREGETAGVNAWTAALANGASRPDVVLAFLDAPEFRQALEPVTRLHRAAFGDGAPEVSLRHWQERLRTGSSLDEVAAGLAATVSFRARYGALSNGAFVAAMYRDVLGRDGDSGGVAFWTQRLDQGLPRSALLQTFAESQEFQVAQSHGTFLTQLYASLLRRTADPSGFDAWLAHLRAGVSRRTILQAFLGSAEYTARFAR